MEKRAAFELAQLAYESNSDKLSGKLKFGIEEEILERREALKRDSQFGFIGVSRTSNRKKWKSRFGNKLGKPMVSKQKAAEDYE